MLQRDPKRTAYQTGQNYPSQENTGNASAPESQGLNPSTKRLSTDDYFRMLSEQMGQIAVDIANTKAMVAQAADREHIIRITQFDTDYPLPTGSKWQTAYISRPSMEESLYKTGLIAHDLFLYFDMQTAVLVPFYGQIVIPVFDYLNVRAHNDGPGGAGTYPATWAIEVILTTRQYNPPAWTLNA